MTVVRRQRFLEYVVEQVKVRNLLVSPGLQNSAIRSSQPLAGKASELKEYISGIPDAVLPVEARRLRSKRAEYHQVERQAQ